MSLTAQDIEIITRLLKDSAFDELELEIDGLKLTLRREAGPPPLRARVGGAVAAAAPTGAAPGSSGDAPRAAEWAAPSAAAAPAVPTAPAAPATATPAAQPDAARPGSRGVAPATPRVSAPDGAGAAAPGTLVTAPLLGTFYRAPRPGAEPFVKEGSAVEPDTVIGIIEVMKLMNAVHAGLRGHVSEILVQDGALVEYAQPLLRVNPR